MNRYIYSNSIYLKVHINHVYNLFHVLFSYTLLIYTPQVVNYSSLMLMNIFQNVVREWVKYGQDLSLKNKQTTKKKPYYLLKEVQMDLNQQ